MDRISNQLFKEHEARLVALQTRVIKLEKRVKEAESKFERLKVCVGKKGYVNVEVTKWKKKGGLK